MATASTRASTVQRRLASMALLITSGCASGAGATATTTPSAATTERPATARRGMATVAEVGALSESEAQHSFASSLEGLHACIEDGARRLPVVGGDIEFAVRIDAWGRARRVWASKSSLGDRRTEKCMFDALRRVRWPTPQGGAFGIARNRFEFQRNHRVEAPGVWDAGRVQPVLQLESVRDALAECRSSGPGKLLVTLYIGTGGRALAGGAASDESVPERAVDCVVDTLLAADYPAPERSPTQVRFRL